MTYSRMTLGEPMLKAAAPPRDTEPCVEPYVTGENILPDGGFEQQLATFGGGPLGFEIPMIEGNFGGGYITQLPYEWSDGSPAPSGSNFKTDQFSGPAGANTARWTISTANPDSGTYHLRQVIDLGGTLYGYLDGLYLSNVTVCSNPTGSRQTFIGYQDLAYAAVVKPGDLVSVSVRVTATPLTDSPWSDLTFYWLDGDGEQTSSDQGAAAPFLTTSYQTSLFEVFVPAGTVGMYVGHIFGATGTSTTTTFDLDNFVLGIS